MSKDKDDNESKDNVIRFPGKTPDPDKVLLFTGKNKRICCYYFRQ